ncbi:ABC transporter substrate-binding protein [Oceanithermus sp.]|uniref:ABC transporter substrate-binding protein n=1 Tax=Oceanithermus sp. TaxID=2268145 RepID=UPI0025FFBE84|nr:ABC transporter substrate-binding protein [Oceanithermus sp.]
MRKSLLVAALLVLGSFGLAQVKIGINLELSGRFAAIGNQTLNGIKVANLQTPEVLGQKVELVICDNETSREGSIACAQRFVNEGVIGVLGAISSSMSIPAAEVLQDAGIIMISTSSTNPQTTQIGDYIFRMAYTDDFQGKLAAAYVVKDLGAKKVAIFRQIDDDYSYGLAGFFDETAKKLGAKTLVQDYVANTVDFTAQLNNIRSFKPDAIYYSGFCAEGAPFMKQLREQGFDQQVVGADASDDPQCPEGAGAAFDGYIFTGFATPNLIPDPEAKKRAEAFKAKYFEVFKDAKPGDFNGFVLAGADAYNVLVAAIKAAGTTDVKAVRDALANIEHFPGVSGDITYKGTDGTPKDRTIGFYQYKVKSASDWTKIELFGKSTAEVQ